MRETLSLHDALAIERGAIVSLSGAGGKTALMYALAAEAVGDRWRVVTTTTTRIYPPSERESPTVIFITDSAQAVSAVAARLAGAGQITAARGLQEDGKLLGLLPDTVDALAVAEVADLIVVEADGAAGRPLKAPRAGEPVWPRSSTLCVAVMGVDALGAPLDDAWIFRSALAAEITGLQRGEPVTPRAAAELLVGARGLTRDAPPAARVAVFLNKVETTAERDRALAFARLLLERPGRLSRVGLGSLASPGRGFTVLDR